MMMEVRSAVAGQYGAALSMLRGCAESADSATWRAVVGRLPNWHVIYRTLYCTDQYLSVDEQAFLPQPFHQENYQYLGLPPWAPD
jgi:hypothetical protein